MKKLILTLITFIFFSTIIACPPPGTGEPFNLTIEIIGPDGVSQPTWGTTNPASGEQLGGAKLQLEVTPSSTDYGFVKWASETGSELSRENPYSFTMPGHDTTIKVVLGETYTLNILVVDSTGTEQPTWGTTIPASGSLQAETSLVRMKATPSINGRKFTKWTTSTGTQLSTDNPYNILMPAEDTTIKVVFEEFPIPPSFTLTNFDETQVTFPGDFEDKYVLLTFSAGWCGPCNTQAEYMVQNNGIFDQLENLGVDNFVNLVVLMSGYTNPSTPTLANAQTYANNHSGLEYVLVDSSRTAYNAYETFITTNGFEGSGSVWGYVPANIMIKPIGNGFVECLDFFTGSPNDDGISGYITYLQEVVPDMFN